MAKKELNGVMIAGADTLLLEDVKKRVKKTPKKAKDFFIIGIGASAGGLEALKEFFDHVPANIPHSFVIVQHLSPDYKSLMTELLAKNTQLPIHEVADRMEIEPGSIYLIPAKKNMTIRDKTLHLVDKPAGHGLNLPIDIFFNSLAEDQGAKAIGIILTGTGSDGTRGLLAIKEAGGMAMVQNPETAKFNGMPKSAVATGLIDYILSIDQMPGELLHYISNPKLEPSQFDKQLMQQEDAVMKILLHLKTYTALDFTSYKRPTLIRRISRRMTVNNCANVDDYLNFLTENTSEAQTLYKEFLIGVTRFFRDTKAFDVLAKKVIPDIIKNAKLNEPVKVWSVGCCTGEEAYSIAILFKEVMEKLKKHVDVKIFATDLDKTSIEKAGRGIYEESSVGDLSPERLKRYFIKKGSVYQVTQELRKMIIFSHHNVLQDPPFNKMSLVSTRNLMIYLQPNMQRRLLATVHYSLNLNGYLFLGTSETVADFKKVFNDVDRRWKIYRNKEVARMMNLDSLSNPAHRSQLMSNGVSKSTRSSTENRLADVLNDALTEELGCASVYVDENLNIIHAHGNLNKYLSLPETGFSVNLQKMLPDSLVVAINTSIRKSVKEKLNSVYKGVRLRQKNQIRKVVILVKTFQMDRLDTKKYYLIIFFKHSIEELSNKKVKDFVTPTNSKALVHDLEEELKETKENLQLAIEELETSNEELQATNEEMLAANEELQSTNEELQSVNEELYTVNTEHQEKIQELASVNTDMDNFLKSTEIGTIFLDKYLRIRTFTPAIQDQLNLLHSDIGRPISNFTNNLGAVDIAKDANKVLETGAQIEKEVMGKGRWYLMRLVPFRNEVNQIEGVVITFVDITNMVNIKKALAESQRLFDSFMEHSPLLTWIKNEKGDYVYVNKAFEEHFDIDRRDLIGKNDLAIYPAEIAMDLNVKLQSIFDTWQLDSCIEKLDHGNNKFVFKTVRFPFIGVDEKRYLGGISKDITDLVRTEESLREEIAERKKARQEIEDLNKNLEAKIEQRTAQLKDAITELESFSYSVSHDLRAPLRVINGFAKVIEEDYSKNFDDEAKRLFAGIQRNTDKMGKLIDYLLEFSRVGKTVIKRKEMNMTDLVNDVLAVQDCGQASIHVDELLSVKGDYSLIRQVWINLISNAVKYSSKQQEPKITIRSERKQDNIIYSIQDNGAGFDMKYADKLFNVFQRLHKPEEFEGTGIGLAIVSRVVMKHEGKVWAESSPGAGTTFYFSLPID